MTSAPLRPDRAPVWRVRGVVLPDGEPRDLYLVGDRITLEPARGAYTLADGGWLLPGLVDAHCHIGLRTSGSPVGDMGEAKALALTNRATGVLTIRDAGSPFPYAELDDDPDMPRLVRAGRHLAPPGGYVPGVSHECDAADLPAAVATQAGAGNGWVKLVGDFFDPRVGAITANWPEETLRAAVESAHAHGARVAAHTLGEDAVGPLLAAGVDSIEHGAGLRTDLIDEMARRGTALVPTVLAIDTMRPMAAVAEPDFPRYAASLRRALARFPNVVRTAYEAGVPLYVGTDAGCEVRHGRIVDELLALHEQCGLAATDVLAAGSWRARDWLGLGRLTEGGPADVLVLDEDPRRNLSALRSPRRIVLRGRVVR